GVQPYELLVEMNELLASPDPVLRDEVAYGAAARWVYRKRLLSADEQLRLVELWRGNLAAGIGERGTDSVLRRSFSALNLSLLAALDNEAPFLSRSDFDGLLSAALEYSREERDTRGYDPAKGWMHAAGHTADLLKFLARNPRLAVADQRRLLDAVAEKCSAFGEVFAWGEGERLAQVVRSVIRRPDFDRAAFDAWAGAFPEQHRELWAKAPAIDVARYVAVQNVKDVLRSTHAALAMDADLAPNAEGAQAKLLEALGGMR
ncbi:MAG TPA: DUF2785 domain-containing protein, partial [Thermoanaerobaculia bacterium]|nr:DUF2785 domain-containing protein [Thermoanaerobaculia bacterium]